jgi:hypothetical protein
LIDVEAEAEHYSGRNPSMLLHELEQLYQLKNQWGDAERILREIHNKQQGICMLLCNVQSDDSAYIKPARIRRLFGDLNPFMTGQYNHEKTGEWRTVAAEKTLAMIPLLQYLKKMKAGELSGNSFATLMKGRVREAVKALADNEGSFIDWQKKLSRLDTISDTIKHKASKTQRPKLQAEQFEIAQDFLKTIGVFFGKKDDTKRVETDPGKPIVPDWDFDSMIAVLQRRAESLKRLPEKPVDKEFEDINWIGPAVSLELCLRCVHCSRDLLCEVGRPVQPFWDDIDSVTEKCDAYHKIPAKLNPWEPTKK